MDSREIVNTSNKLLLISDTTSNIANVSTNMSSTTNNGNNINETGSNDTSDTSLTHETTTSNVKDNTSDNAKDNTKNNTKDNTIYNTKNKEVTGSKTGVPIVVDATDHIAGRLSSVVAKLLLKGNRVSLVNCENIMLSGTRANIILEYRNFLKINSIIHPKHGPVHYRRPDTMITKMIRGMLPFEKKPSGITAHKRLRAYIGSPKNLKSFKKIQFKDAKIRRQVSNYTTMAELGRVIGWTE